MPYRTDHNTVVAPENDTKLRFSSIWYSLKTLMLVPEQISSVTKQTPLTPEDHEKINAQTKQLVLNIENIIANSDTYFKLILETPLMYKLFKQLNLKLQEFSALSYDAALTQIEEINTTLFTEILLRTDQWEDKIGLKPGQLSGPMKTLLGEFYKGLVEPLGFTSQKHIALIASDSPITARLAATEKRKKEAAAKINNSMPSYLVLEKLMQNLKIYQNLNSHPPASYVARSLAEKELITAFNVALPILEQARGTIIPLLAGEIEPSPIVDKFLGPKIPLVVLPQAEPAIVGPRPNLQSEPVNTNAAQIANEDEQIWAMLLAEPNVLTQCQIVINYYRQLRCTDEQAKWMPDYLVLMRLINKVKSYHKISSTFHPLPVIDWLAEFKEVLPILNREKAVIAAFSGKIAPLPPIEQLLAPPKILRETNITAQCRIVYNYYLGLVNTQKLAKDSAQEKIIYLQNLQKEHLLTKEKVTIDYVKNAFAREVQLASNRHIGLVHTGKEYNDALNAYLLPFEKEIQTEAITSADIDQLVKGLIAEKAKHFDQEFYKKYFHLEQIMIGITEFKMYITTVRQANNTFFETPTTLAAKEEVIQRLEKTVKDVSLSIDERVSKMQAITRNDHDFKKIMLAHSMPNPFTLDWLVQLVTSFLQLLRLYTPTYHRLYEQLDDAVAKPPDQQRINRYRMFGETSSQPRRYQVPQPLQVEENQATVSTPVTQTLVPVVS